MTGRSIRRTTGLLLVAILLVGALPGVAAAETRSGGTIVVQRGETVHGLQAFGGTIVVEGTVDGNLDAFGGSVVIQGTVTGDVNAFAGDVRVAGTVDGDVDAAAGNVAVEPGARIGGSLSAAGGTVDVAGTVGGDATLSGGNVTLAGTATVGRDVRYAVGQDGSFTNEGATVGGAITRSEDVRAGPTLVPPVPGWLFDVYAFLVNLLLGAILLAAFPRFSATVVERVLDRPLWTGGVGLLALVGVPVVLVLLLFTVVGIPLSLVGALLFALLLWVSLVYGRYAVGTWLLSLVDVDNRWAALLVGLVLLGAAGRTPWIGGVVDFVVVLLGLGAVTAIGYAGYQRRRARRV